jgi:hypothetical protein
MKKYIFMLLAVMVMGCTDSPVDPTPGPEQPEQPDQPSQPSQPSKPDADFESRFIKQIALWDFTGAWCNFCPGGLRNISFVLTANPQFADCVHTMAFHSNSEGEDDLALPDGMTDRIMTDMNLISFGFPSFLLDMKIGGTLAEGSNLSNDLKQIAEDYPTYCGVALSSAVADGKATVNAKLFSEFDTTWRLAAFVVENKIKYYQMDGMQRKENATHNHVVRQIVSASYRGDRLGQVAADAEASKEYVFDVDPVWNLENTFIYVLAIDAEGVVNNMNYCLLNGGESDYITKQ